MTTHGDCTDAGQNVCEDGPPGQVSWSGQYVNTPPGHTLARVRLKRPRYTRWDTFTTSVASNTLSSLARKDILSALSDGAQTLQLQQASGPAESSTPVSVTFQTQPPRCKNFRVSRSVICVQKLQNGGHLFQHDHRADRQRWRLHAREKNRRCSAVIFCYCAAVFSDGFIAA